MTPGTRRSSSMDCACHARTRGPLHKIPNRTGRGGAIAVSALSDIRARDGPEII